MPAESQAQRGFLANKFGIDWMRLHHFDNKGKLPEHVREKSAKGKSGEVPMFDGGIAKLPPGITPLPKSQYGTDTIPSALTPDEMVLTGKQQKAVMPIPGKEHMLKPDQLGKFKTIHGPRGWIGAPRMKFDTGFAGMPAPQGGPTFMPPVTPPGITDPPQFGRTPPIPRTPPMNPGFGDIARPNPIAGWSPFGPPQAGQGNALAGPANPMDKPGMPPWVENHIQNRLGWDTQHSPMDIFNYWQQKNPQAASNPRFSFQDGYGGTGTPSPSATPYTPKTPEDFDKIPIGEIFIDPKDGRKYRKTKERDQQPAVGSQLDSGPMLA